MLGTAKKRARAWKHADRDKDGRLTEEEFQGFLQHVDITSNRSLN